MAAKKRTLGRGLDRLLSNTESVLQNDTATVTAEKKVEQQSQPSKDAVHTMPLSVFQRGKYQPRKDMNVGALEELASSIRLHGVIQPIVARPISKDRYEIIAGERRWRAAQMAELEEIPVILRDLDDQSTVAVALIENIQRENLNPVEEAIAIQRLIEEFEMTHQEVANALGKSRTTVTNLLRLISLCPEVKEFLMRGDIEFGHAKVLLALEDSLQTQAARTVIAKNLSVRETEALVKKLQSPAAQFNHKRSIDPDVRQLQTTLSERLGASVSINHSSRGKGKLVIKYNSLDELDGILDHIK